MIDILSISASLIGLAAFVLLVRWVGAVDKRLKDVEARASVSPETLEKLKRHAKIFVGRPGKNQSW